MFSFIIQRAARNFEPRHTLMQIYVWLNSRVTALCTNFNLMSWQLEGSRTFSFLY